MPTSPAGGVVFSSEEPEPAPATGSDGAMKAFPSLCGLPAIQWLGTNCGRAFLIEAFQDAGYALVIRKNKTMSE
jgi:hypothetical protein